MPDEYTCNSEKESINLFDVKVFYGKTFTWIKKVDSLASKKQF